MTQTPKIKNDCIQTFLQGFTPAESTDYFLCKATKKVKRFKKTSPSLKTSQGTSVRSNLKKIQAFAEHLAKGFHPRPSENEPEEERLIQLLETPFQHQLCKSHSQ
jgi:hypothetical protein